MTKHFLLLRRGINYGRKSLIVLVTGEVLMFAQDSNLMMYCQSAQSQVAKWPTAQKVMCACTDGACPCYGTLPQVNRATDFNRIYTYL